MTFSLAAKLSVLLLFIGSTLYVHLRGKARLPMLRQFVNHSALFAPYNALMYLFSAVPSKPYLDRSKFPELDVLKDNWEVIREEAMHLFDEGYIRAAEKNNDAGFGSFFKKGWKRFYLKWYDKPLPSAEALCPKTVALVSSIPNVKGAMFALLPGGSHLNPHRDPFAGSLRYHLGLSTPNSDDCRIFVDGQVYAWRDGEDVMFDETYVHWVKNETEQTRVILFCDIERPLSNRVMTRINRWVSKQLGRATAPQNLDDERVGGINQAYAWSKTFSDKFSGQVKQWKRKHPKAYRIARPVLAVVVLVLLWKWLFIYPEQGIATVNELAAPVDRPIEFRITASTVMNSFYIPALAGQIYAMPGMQTKLNAVINKPGEFEGFSANYSGAGFSDMRFKFHGVSDGDFDAWVKKVKSSGGALKRAEYMALEKPSIKDPVQHFNAVDGTLFHAILNRCVAEGQVCMDQQMMTDKNVKDDAKGEKTEKGAARAASQEVAMAGSQHHHE